MCMCGSTPRLYNADPDPAKGSGTDDGCAARWIASVASNERTEFGDFQTPPSLARLVCGLLGRSGVSARSVLEPSCGEGVFLEEAARAFPEVVRFLGFDIQPHYVEASRHRMASLGRPVSAEVRLQDFFRVDCTELLRQLDEPLLVIGNPPWVTNSHLSRLGSRNVPEKANRDRLRGIDAVTGKSNFDVSQWMIDRLLESMRGRCGTLAVLCKTRVARAALTRAWRDGGPAEAAIYRVDAMLHFGAAVDACLLVCRFQSGAKSTRRCALYSDLNAVDPTGELGYEAGRLVQDPDRYCRVEHLAGGGPHRWRSGIKHDCARVLELRRDGTSYWNGLGQRVEVEDESLFPLLKGSRLARGLTEPDRWLVVPQLSVGADTSRLRDERPRTWNYLESHAERFDRRASTIYRGRSRFSIFGVGEYSFSAWKIAIAGFAKSLRFHKLGLCENRPIVLDDTCYFLPCSGEKEAELRLSLLNHPMAVSFFSCFVFWDMKRPVTAEILHQLDLERLGREVRDASRQCVVG